MSGKYSSTGQLPRIRTLADPATCAATLADIMQPFDIQPAGQSQAILVACGTDLRPSDFLGRVPGIVPAQLGSATFCRAHNVNAAYAAGAMANGIASVDLVAALAEAGFLAFFGAAGLDPKRVEGAIIELKERTNGASWGANLIHSPNEQTTEAAVASLYIRHKVSPVEASAYLGLTPHIVRYRVSGLEPGTGGAVRVTRRVVAKVSRVEVARRFLAPPPEPMVRELLARGEIRPDQAELARRVPMCDDLTTEADSGGHTDNRPALALLPAMLALRDQFQREHRYAEPIRVGLAGGISTPGSAAAAYAMGADYIVTGSVNQACVESGSSDIVRQMLAEAEQADVVMAPAADMFEMGVKVQVLKRGTMFAMRGDRLFKLYREYGSLEALPDKEREWLEKTILRRSIDEAWNDTLAFFQSRDPAQAAKAEADPHHKMALVFRSYLGLSSRWANAGEASRKVDYQVWCGPAMGAFNEWVKGSHLETAKERRVIDVACNILYGAALLTRASMLRVQGVEVAPEHLPTQPRPVDEIWRYFQ